jgi:hypothetical protein
MNSLLSSILASLLAGLVFGSYAGYQYSQGQHAIATNIEQRATEAANKATASAIAAITVRNTTIYQKVQQNVKSNPIYRSASCVHDADSMRSINAAFE